MTGFFQRVIFSVQQSSLSSAIALAKYVNLSGFVCFLLVEIKIYNRLWMFRICSCDQNGLYEPLVQLILFQNTTITTRVSEASLIRHGGRYYTQLA